MCQQGSCKVSLEMGALLTKAAGAAACLQLWLIAGGFICAGILSRQSAFSGCTRTSMLMHSRAVQLQGNETALQSPDWKVHGGAARSHSALPGTRRAWHPQGVDPVATQSPDAVCLVQVPGAQLAVPEGPTITPRAGPPASQSPLLFGPRTPGAGSISPLRWAMT